MQKIFKICNYMQRGSLPLRSHSVAPYPLCGLKRRPQRRAFSQIPQIFRNNKKSKKKKQNRNKKCFNYKKKTFCTNRKPFC